MSEALRANGVETPRIFATLAWGFDPERWGVLGFSNESVRNKLGGELRGGGLVLTMGTMGEDTPEPLRGRLMALHKLGTRAIATQELVEPEHWRRHLDEHNGRPKWPYGLPILTAEGFDDPLPLRSEILPRLHADNLHQKLATNYEELTVEEVRRVLAAPRTAVAEIWSSPVSDFIGGMTRPPKGPPPTSGERVLLRSSGPAATYCFQLRGTALAQTTINVAPAWSRVAIFKIGFSNDPARRRKELNTYLPDIRTLEWGPVLEQWHGDEINAWAMEQEVFVQLLRRAAVHVKGEIFAAKMGTLESAWTTAMTSTRRPTEPVHVAIGEEEQVQPA